MVSEKRHPRMSPRDAYNYRTTVVGKMDPWHLRLYSAVGKHQAKQTRSWKSLTPREKLFLRMWAGLIPDRYPTRMTEMARILDCSQSWIHYVLADALGKLGLERRHAD